MHVPPTRIHLLVKANLWPLAARTHSPIVIFRFEAVYRQLYARLRRLFPNFFQIQIDHLFHCCNCS